MHSKVDKILYSEEEINNAISILGQRITNEFKNKEITIVCVLKGAMIFYGKLMPKLSGIKKINTDYIRIKSYSRTKVSDIKIIHDVQYDLSNRDILIVEDIIDTGHSMKFLHKHFKNKGVKSITSIVLGNKLNARVTPIEPDYHALLLPNDYVVGFGYDFNDDLRHLNYIGTLKKEFY